MTAGQLEVHRGFPRSDGPSLRDRRRDGDQSGLTRSRDGSRLWAVRVRGQLGGPGRRGALVGLDDGAAGAERAGLAHRGLQQRAVHALGRAGGHAQLVQAGEQAAEAELVAHATATPCPTIFPLHLGHAHEEMRVRQRLAVRLGEGDRLGVVPDLLEEIQDRHAVLERRGTHANVHSQASSSGPGATTVRVPRATRDGEEPRKLRCASTFERW